VEPWFIAETWRPKAVHATSVDEPNVRSSKISTTKPKGETPIAEMQKRADDQ
jgi:hypothetical protein